MDPNDHERFMRMALQEAAEAAAEGEVPVGAVIVAGGRVIARAHNLTERLIDVTAHAEIQAITAASNYLGSKYLNKCTLYVTLEPCPMCGGALFWSQIGTVVYGASDLKRGYELHGGALHPKTTVIRGVLEEECGTMMTDFFAKRRN
ncbi:MAG: hypothetical protein RL754_900 [Bacteroidota bacterium]